MSLAAGDKRTVLVEMLGPPRFGSFGTMPGMKAVRLLLAAVVLSTGASRSQSAAPSRAGATTLVPFVGCKSDGQVGPLDAPDGRPEAVDLPAAFAKRLAFYKAEQGWGVLAPRGWYCFSTYGSAAANLYVSPDPIDSAELVSDEWTGFSGDIVQISYEYGDTSGRFGVADTIARVFPAYMSFVRGVIAEDIEPASSFPSGPYPHDKLRYLNRYTLEFETPAHEKGLGTFYGVRSNADPIFGVAALTGGAPDLVLVAMRLSERDRDLMRSILEEVEHRGAQVPPK